MTEENIFLFVPNLIGYARIALALLAFYLMPSYPVPAMFFYLLSALLDAFDGHAARALNQGRCWTRCQCAGWLWLCTVACIPLLPLSLACVFPCAGTKFGAMLDMLTDRCATMCLLVNLALLYPSFTFLFQLSMSLDVASHWLHLHSSIMKGASSHKAIDLSGNPVLRLYYTSRPVLFFMCMGNELFYCLLYILHLLEEPQGEPVAVTPEPLHPSLSLPFPSAILHPFVFPYACLSLPLFLPWLFSLFPSLPLCLSFSISVSLSFSPSASLSPSLLPLPLSVSPSNAMFHGVLFVMLFSPVWQHGSCGCWASVASCL
uniref:CDP-diacylglycerol--inositol 3-phosphatidyltransferase (phosphatidylinositol synthase) n=1 Tax=Paramormyrops kingsleyae TaxID=1676925 RepID=A0A3B3TEM0_9TELE